MPFGRGAAPEPNKRALYVGGLDLRDVLDKIFETAGHVQNVKIIPAVVALPAPAPEIWRESNRRGMTC
ncbi:hypothetical protein QBC32DRAFT_225955 [Pseudoneurospora amorphoporcata]|uniref:Uncharacterized protein n=1 Tax=Pseudoneurospora amorphoporcata TaxID=241081 RepID=A0AAN6NMT2_9PEZI|nr:hypothetical protein QBC32DRAFT_225955 [Pseudoneurospora amorphoporcata]